jgi:hypothetical protein
MVKTQDQNGLPVQPAKMLTWVGVLEVLGKRDFTEIEEGGKLRDGEVPHTPGVLELVGDASVEEEAPPRGSHFVNSDQGLDEERERAAPEEYLDDVLPGPGGEFGAKSDLRRFVVLPAGVIWASRVPQGQPGFGHDHTSLGDSCGDRVEGAQPAVPLHCSHED